MKFEILKENIRKGLSIVNKSISLKPQIPILSNILIEAKDNQVKLAATNLELGIISKTGAKVEKSGKVAVGGKLLFDFVNATPGEKLDFEHTGTTLTVKSKESKATFPTVNPTDFPPFSDIPKTTQTLPLSSTKDAILRVVFAASIDETRPVLTGVKTLIGKGMINLVATDGYRLSKESVEFSGKTEEMEVILPAQSLAEVIKTAQEVGTESVSFALIPDKNQTVFILNDTYIFTRLIDGEFPNVDKIIPQEFKTKILIDKEQFEQSVKTASLFARGAANIVKVSASQNKLHISASSPQVGEHEATMDAKVDGEKVEIAFNYRFLLDLLSIFPAEEIIFETSGSLNPGVFRSKSTKLNFFHLIMPVRIQD